MKRKNFYLAIIIAFLLNPLALVIAADNKRALEGGGGAAAAAGKKLRFSSVADEVRSFESDQDLFVHLVGEKKRRVIFHFLLEASSTVELVAKVCGEVIGQEGFEQTHPNSKESHFLKEMSPFSLNLNLFRTEGATGVKKLEDLPLLHRSLEYRGALTDLARLRKIAEELESYKDKLEFRPCRTVVCGQDTLSQIYARSQLGLFFLPGSGMTASAQNGFTDQLRGTTLCGGAAHGGGGAAAGAPPKPQLYPGASMFRTASASVRSFVEEHTGHKQYSYEEIMRARGLNFYREAGLLLEPVQELKILFDHDEEAFLKEKLWSERGLKRLQRIERKAQLKENYLEDYQAIFLKIREQIETDYSTAEDARLIHKEELLKLLEETQTAYEKYRTKEDRDKETKSAVLEKLSQKGLGFEGMSELLKPSGQESLEDFSTSTKKNSTRSISFYIPAKEQVTQMAEVLHKPSYEPGSSEDFFTRKKESLAQILSLYEGSSIEEIQAAYEGLYASNGHIYSINLGIFREGQDQLPIRNIFAGLYLIAQLQERNKDFIPQLTIYLGKELVHLDLEKLQLALNIAFDTWKIKSSIASSEDQKALINKNFVAIVSGKLGELFGLDPKEFLTTKGAAEQTTALGW